MNRSAPPDDRSFLPTTSLEALRLRAQLTSAVRQFFESRGYWEVETPLLSHDVIVDAHLEPFVTRSTTLTPGPSPSGRGAGGEGETADVESTVHEELFLQTSPEFAMKRLLAAGATAIYQITRALRQGEIGRHHNPEFTMIEWYRVGATHHEQMTFTEALVNAVFNRAKELQDGGRGLPFSGRPAAGARGKAPPLNNFERMTYDEAFERYVGNRVLDRSPAQLARLAHRHELVPPPGLHPEDRDGWLNLLLAELVEPQLGQEHPVFIYDYPASQAALARVRGERSGVRVAERFELYVDGLEVCNGYHELTDPAEYRERVGRQSTLRAEEGRRPLPHHSRLLEAMEAGLPACAGVALGFDRLVMLALGAGSLQEVMAFPFERA